MKKVGIIRCMQTEDMCSGTADFKAAAKGKCVFESTGPVEIVGFVTCGGCPGKRVIPRAQMMIERGADIIVLASCLARGNPIGYPCPHYHSIREVLANNISTEIEIFEYTH